MLSRPRTSERKYHLTIGRVSLMMTCSVSARFHLSISVGSVSVSLMPSLISWVLKVELMVGRSPPTTYGFIRRSDLSPPSAGGPLLGTLELVEAEQGELAGDHPRQRMQHMDGPFLIGHYRDSLKGRMMMEQSAQAQLEVLDQPAGAEALVIGRDDLHDPDLVGVHHALHGRLELAQVVATQPARYANAGHSLGHVLQYFDHRILLSRRYLASERPSSRRLASAGL